MIVSGPAIQRARELAGLKQDEVATKIGVHRATVAGWESDKPANKPSAANFKALCKLLKVSQHELILVAEEAA
jgi:transcriptional regulator with XRE-family HTH domain